MLDVRISQYVLVVTHLVGIRLYAEKLLPFVALPRLRCGLNRAWPKELQDLVQIIICRDKFSM